MDSKDNTLNLDDVNYCIFLPSGHEKTVDAILESIDRDSLGLAFLCSFIGSNQFIKQPENSGSVGDTLLLFRKTKDVADLNNRVYRIIVEINRRTGGETGGANYSSVRLYIPDKIR